MTESIHLSVENLKKVFPGVSRSDEPVTVFQNLWFHIHENEFVCLIGHSGCGKTTLLNALAGLEKQTAGAIVTAEEEITAPSLDRAVIFQSHALMPWLSALENVAFATRSRWPDWSKQKVIDHSRAYLDKVKLGHAADRKPAQLSGGMKQRVGIARALAVEPKMMLLDEPFGALDALTRGSLQDEILEVMRGGKLTSFMITHDIDEAILLADKIILMSNGPNAMVCEVLSNSIEDRDRATIHHHENYYPMRNYLMDFLVNRSAVEESERPTDAAWPEVVTVTAEDGRKVISERQPVETHSAETNPDAKSILIPKGNPMSLTRVDVTKKIVDAKLSKGLTWSELAEIIGQSKEWSTAALLGQACLSAEQASAIGEKLELNAEEVALLSVPTYRGSLDETVPTDPLVYRFHEIMQVYGITMKELIHEEFGDGIMSAIDFTIDIDRVEDPKGDRVKVVFEGKFLPYKVW